MFYYYEIAADDPADSTNSVVIEDNGDSGVGVVVNDQPKKRVVREVTETTEVIDEDSDNPPAGTPGHPGIDEGTA